MEIHLVDRYQRFVVVGIDYSIHRIMIVVDDARIEKKKVRLILISHDFSFLFLDHLISDIPFD